MYLLPRDRGAVAEFTKRQFFYNNCGYYDNCHSAWYRWGRWVLAGVLIFIGLVILAFILICGARRRRRNYNATPMTTTQAPIGGYNSGYGNQQYGAPPGPPPQYEGNTTYGGYYGQQAGVTQPQTAYKP